MTPRRVLGLLVAGSVVSGSVLSGCGADDAPTPTARSTSVGSTGPVDLIPADLVLPGSGTAGAPGASVEDDTSSINGYLCIDPAADLVDAEVVDGRTWSVVADDNRRTTERLRLYADEAESREAVADFSATVRDCLRGAAESGGQLTSRAFDVTDLDGADQARHVLWYVNESGELLTVARVGRAVYLLDREVPRAALDEDSLASTAAANEDAVRPFLDDLHSLG